jgi:hypothetical protein
MSENKTAGVVKYRDEAINEAIARRCGYRLEREGDGEWSFFDPSGNKVGSDWEPLTTFGSFSYKYPKYAASLDAMAEARKVLSEEEKGRYVQYLDPEFNYHVCVLHEYETYKLATASAIYHAIAFCKATGIWDEATMVLRG